MVLESLSRVIFQFFLDNSERKEKCRCFPRMTWWAARTTWLTRSSGQGWTSTSLNVGKFKSLFRSQPSCLIFFSFYLLKLLLISTEVYWLYIVNMHLSTPRFCFSTKYVVYTYEYVPWECTVRCSDFGFFTFWGFTTNPWDPGSSTLLSTLRRLGLDQCCGSMTFCCWSRFADP